MFFDVQNLGRKFSEGNNLRASETGFVNLLGTSI
jgi:hypothetical protein